MEPSDTQLVLSTTRGDREAFSALARRYRRALYGVALHLLGDAATAEDVTQDALVQGYLRIDELREPGKVGPWLLAIARNLCRQSFRSRAPTVAEWPAEPSVRGPEPAVTEQDLIVRALAALPPASSLALTLFYVGGYSYADIARLLEIPGSTIRGRIERGRARLRKELGTVMEHLSPHTPPDKLEGEVLRRLSAAGVWRSSQGADAEHLDAPFLLIDGEFAQRIAPRLDGTTSVRATRSLHSPDGRPFCVFQVLGCPSRYYVFGRGRLGEGPVYENQLVEARLQVAPVAEETLVTEPWRPEELVLAELRARPRPDRERRLREVFSRARGGLAAVAGRLARAHCFVDAAHAGTATLGWEVDIRNLGPGPLVVYRLGPPDTRYVILGRATATPPEDLVVEYGLLALEAAVPAQGDQHPDLSLAPPEFCSTELFALTQEEQCHLLDPYFVIKVDGQLCVVKLTNGLGTALEAESVFQGQGKLFTTHRPPGRERYYLFGEGTLPELPQPAANAALDVTLAVHPVEPAKAGQGVLTVPQCSARQLWEASDAVGLCGLAPGRPLLLDDTLAVCLAAAIPPGSEISSPGGEVQFRNRGPAPLTVIKHQYPPAHYYVVGEAEVSPPGLRVRNAAVRLQARRVD